MALVAAAAFGCALGCRGPAGAGSGQPGPGPSPTTPATPSATGAGEGPTEDRAEDRAEVRPAMAPISPKLVLLIVVDQLPSWSFELQPERWQGGLRRLLEGGVVYPEMTLPYAITYTASGHAALATGAPPAVTGVLGNYWYRPRAGAQLSATHDPDSPGFFVACDDPVAERDGSSSAVMRVEGVADVLARERAGRSRSVSVSLKDRSAVFGAGRRPDLAIWYDEDQAAMTTSRFYTDRVPAWLHQMYRDRWVESRLDWVWTPLADVDHGARTGVRDDMPGESRGSLLGAVFPHSLGNSSRPADALKRTPLGDELVFETAMRALDGEGLGADDSPDFLVLSFSAHDYAGHYWGQESWERLDLLIRFDRALGHFLESLDRRFGERGWAAVLTSDHGAVRLVEHRAVGGHDAGRVALADIGRVAQGAAARVLGPGEWIAHRGQATLHLAAEFASREDAERSAALDAIVAAVGAIEGVGYAARVDQLAEVAEGVEVREIAETAARSSVAGGVGYDSAAVDGDIGGCDRKSGIQALACRSLIAGLSGDIYYAPEPGYLITSYPTGTGHGAPSRDERVVPAVVYAPGDPRWGQARHAPEAVTILQVAPTLSALLGVSAPAAARAPALP